jgi:two-component system cell cycle sensor histidine kinase/response regulator CckA
MPELTGDELARRARVARPDLPVLFMSGYSEDLVRDRLEKLHPFDHIAKPFSARALRDKVRRALSGESRAREKNHPED